MMTPEQLLHSAYRMEQHGGSFEKCIAAAFFVADSINKQKLTDAFVGIFSKFGTYELADSDDFEEENDASTNN